MLSFYLDGLQFNYATRGTGPHTFLFQHGIGGTIAQPFRFLSGGGDRKPGLHDEPASQGFRMAAFDFRGHGATPLGDPRNCASIDSQTT